jgi:hypothetical protein
MSKKSSKPKPKDSPKPKPKDSPKPKPKDSPKPKPKDSPKPKLKDSPKPKPKDSPKPKPKDSPKPKPKDSPKPDVPLLGTEVLGEVTSLPEVATTAKLTTIPLEHRPPVITEELLFSRTRESNFTELCDSVGFNERGWKKTSTSVWKIVSQPNIHVTCMSFEKSRRVQNTPEQTDVMHTFHTTYKSREFVVRFGILDSELSPKCWSPFWVSKESQRDFGKILEMIFWSFYELAKRTGIENIPALRRNMILEQALSDWRNSTPTLPVVASFTLDSQPTRLSETLADRLGIGISYKKPFKREGFVTPLQSEKSSFA